MGHLVLLVRSRLRRAAVMCLLLGQAVPVAAEVPASCTPSPTVAAFLDSEGVNTHINYTDGAYRQVDSVIADLAYLGIRHIRDALIVPGRGGAPGLSSYTRVAAAGVRFLFYVEGPAVGASDSAAFSFERLLDMVRSLRVVSRDSVEAIEGTNEINNWPITFDGLGPPHELEAALHYQRALYATVHRLTDPSLPVYYFTGYASGGVPIGPDPVGAHGLADFNNQHPYPNGAPPARALGRAQALPNTSDPSEPAVYTESGYSSLGGPGGSVDEDVQAKYTLDLLFDAAQEGIARTYLYELLDAYPTGSRQGNAGFGLFDTRGGPKPVARALHNLNAILRAQVGPRRGQGVASVTISGEGSTGRHLLLRGADGVDVLALWDEQPIWNIAQQARVPPTPHETMVSGSGARSLSLFDPERGIAPLQTTHDARLVVPVSDHVVLVRIEALPASRARPEPAPPRAADMRAVVAGASACSIQP